MKIFLDTNIWLRYIVCDDKKQYNECLNLFREIENGNIRPYTSSIVFLEVAYVLTKIYLRKKQDVIKDIEDMLSTRMLTLIETTDCRSALKLHKKTRLKLSDCLIVTQIPPETILCTFDKELLELKQIPANTPQKLLTL